MEKNIAGFLFSILLFAGIGLFEWKPIEIAVLLVVIFIHELGHFLGMKLFGYHDPKIFFIPGFGAVATAKKSSGNAWHEAIVSLLGPLPGIVIGIIFVLVYYITENRLFYDFAELFLFINLFNLLPISPLDGGRFFETVLFRRNHIIELAFRIVTGLILLGLGIVSQYTLLIVFSVMVLLNLPEIYRISKSAKMIRKAIGKKEYGDDQILHVRRALSDFFRIHKSEKIYILRAKRIIDSLSETTMPVRSSIILVMAYLLLLPVSFFATGATVYLFKSPLNLSRIKDRNQFATFRPGTKDNVVNPLIAGQMQSLETAPFMQKDTSNKIIEKKSHEDIHVGLIALGTSEDAKNARELLLSGSSFEEVAKKHSNGPNAENGGDIGFVNQKDLDEKITESLLQLKAGEISDVIESENGFIIVKRVE